MSKNMKLAALAVGILVVGGGGYWAYDYFAGNHVQVQEVIPASGTVSTGAGAAVEAAKVDGAWNIQPDSKVYFSVTTSKETVNFEAGSVKGSWNLNSADASKNTAEGIVDLNVLQSGNATRDDHVKAEKFLNTAANPEAKFTAKSFTGLPAQWTEGAEVPFKINGSLTVKGITKDVTFDSKALYTQGAIKVEGATTVRFDDFGMANPHAVVVDTENNVAVQLRLNLGK